jgi:hypothetical protein
MTTRRLIQVVIALGVVAAVLGACASPAPPPAAPTQAGAQGGSSNPVAPASNATPEKNNVEVAANEPQVFMLEPEDGASVTSPFILRMGVANAKIPISEMVIHVAIDAACAPAGQVINQDAQHVSFPRGQLQEARFNLPTGRHRLCIQASNQDNVALEGPGMVRVYDIEVTP